jgi:beta-galactosidase
LPGPASPLSHPMKKLYHGACYYPELWPEADIERDIVEMQRLGLNYVRIGEFAWAKIEPDEGRISMDFFTGVMDQMYAAGIDVIFCTPTPTPPIWLTHDRPDRCFVDSEGRTMSHGARQHPSYDHPEVEAACYRVVEAVAAAIGRHPALIGWQIDNEFKCHVAEDFNAHSVTRWHRWLEARFGSIDQLNNAWGTEIWSQRYQRFDQVPAPVRTPFAHNASLSTAYRMCARERIAEFMDGQSAIIRRHSAAPITHNFNPNFALNFERMCAHLDFASFDDYPDRNRWNGFVFDNDLFRAAKPGRAHWVMETSVAHNGWLVEYETTHPPGFLVAEAVSSYALGAEGIGYWLWRQQRSGCELPHSAVLSSWFKPTVGYASVQAVATARQQLEPLLLASRPAAAEVALTWSDHGRAMIQTEPIGANRTFEVNFNRSLEAWHQLLLDAGLHRDVRFAGAALDGLKLLVTPMMPHVDAEFLAKVERFVRAGGVWLCAPVTGMRTAEHTVPTDAGLGAIEALAGVESVFSFPITGTGETGEAFGLTSPLTGWCNALQTAHADTQVLGQLHSAIAPGLALITKRKLGAGAIIVLGAMPAGDQAAPWLTKLIEHCAQTAGVTERADSTAGTLVCPRVMEDGSKLWIAVNMNGRGGGFSLPSGGRDAVSGESLPAGEQALAPYEWRAVRL